MMTNNYFLILIAIFSYGCGVKEKETFKEGQPNKNMASVRSINNDKVVLSALVANTGETCKNLLKEDNALLKQKEVIECIENTTGELLPLIVDNLLKHKPPVSIKILTNVVEKIAQNPFKAKYTNAIRRLMEAGASTQNISIQLVLDGSDVSCSSLMLILKSNKRYYESMSASSKAQINKESREGDLHFLSDTGNGRAMCPKAIFLLAGYNPKLLDKQDERGYTPVHYYFEDSNHPQWNIRIAKLLMTKKNINMQTNIGNTPLHMLLQYNKSKWDLDLIKTARALGANMYLKNKKDTTVKDLIIKRNK